MEAPLYEFFDALANPTRMAIVNALIEAEGPMSVKEVASKIVSSQPNVSRSLTQMKKAGVVEVESAANQRLYTLNYKVPVLLRVARQVIEEQNK